MGSLKVACHQRGPCNYLAGVMDVHALNFDIMGSGQSAVDGLAKTDW